MTYVTVDPMRGLARLQHEMSRLMRDAFDSESASGGAFVQPVDIVERGEDLVLFADLPGVAVGDIDASVENKEIPGATVFKLYDTFGFPVDLTADIARERELVLDMVGFEREMDAQRERARAASQFGVDYNTALKVEGCTDFTGYDKLIDQGRVTALFRGSEAVQQLNTGEEGAVILDHTPFYAESGGQVGDRGVLETANARFAVRDTQKQQGVHVHVGVIEFGSLKLGDTVEARLDETTRRATMLNHSATHLLHAALRTVLGTHVQQKGSLVNPERLRFDFAHFEAVKPEELARIERMVNEQIRVNQAVETRVMGMEDAVKAGAMSPGGRLRGRRRCINGRKQ